MKPSTQAGSIPNHGEFRILETKRKQMNSTESNNALQKLYIDLCNLIVESRVPGINERGYGEGIHCPPLVGKGTHCCNLTIPECQKYQKVMQRLLRSSRSYLFHIEVLLLPDCCVNDQESKLNERISNQEYFLLERWSLNCHTSCTVQPYIDISQLLRAVRSFLYFSQLSAWLSTSKGKSPSNIYYWVKTPNEMFSTKFDIESETHTFPLCNINESLYGNIEVNYRPRTQYVPIIPCSKHPPLYCSPYRNIISETKICHNIPLNLHSMKQLQNTCSTCYSSSAISSKTTSSLALPLVQSNMSPAKISGECIVSKSNRTHSFSNTQANVENLPNANSDIKFCENSLTLLINSNKCQLNNLSFYHENLSTCSSQQNKNLKRHSSLQLREPESKQSKKINNERTSSHLINSSFKKKLLKFHQENKEDRKLSVFCLSRIAKPKIDTQSSLESFSPQQKNNTNVNQNFNALPLKHTKKLSKKRKFTLLEEDPSKLAPSQKAIKDRNIVSLASTSCSGNIQQTEIKSAISHINVSILPARVSNNETINDICVTERILRDVKNTSSKISGKINSDSSLENKEVLQEDENNKIPIKEQIRMAEKLPLPSSPVPFRDDLSKNSILLKTLPCSTRRALFQKLNSSSNILRQRSKFKKAKRLLGTFEESILKGCLHPVNNVTGFTVEIGASGYFCPDHIKLPADVNFYELGSFHEGAAPYVAHVMLSESEYYVPKKGAVQVTLFNPSGTVVRVFVVNYDLNNMPSLCHTFIRQKTYYMPLNANERDPSQKWLRYIIHLKFASSRNGKIYLHKDLKIVILNKSDVDAASIHAEEPHELRSFICMPSNPSFFNC